MVLFDEMHTVTIAIGGVSNRVATANLNDDVDTPVSLRLRAVRSAPAGLDEAAVGIAFDEAFETCERIPGSVARGVVEGEGFTLTVSRSLEG